ncbi:MAG: metallophosphoesterase [Methanobacteriales archaeon]
MIGIMADSHDNLPVIREAVDLLNHDRVDMVLHAGDLISPFTAKEFNELKMPFEAIFGNNDGEKDGLRAAYSNICDLKEFKVLKVDGVSIAMIHGHQEELVECLASCGKYDVVIRGHSHQNNVEEKGSLLIDPGELCGYVSGKKTFRILDLDDLSHELVEL